MRLRLPLGWRSFGGADVMCCRLAQRDATGMIFFCLLFHTLIMYPYQHCAQRHEQTAADNGNAYSWPNCNKRGQKKKPRNRCDSKGFEQIQETVSAC